MKFLKYTAFAASVSAHSWLGCTNQDNTDLRKWMEGNATKTIVDPGMGQYQYLCSGYPRNKQNPGDWREESDNYLWDLNLAKGQACRPSQKSSSYFPNAPMASAAPGGMIRLWWQGNGHARGVPMSPNGGDPGTVGVYWKGKPESEIVDVKEFTKENLLKQQGFAEDSYIWPANTKVVKPERDIWSGIVDKGNWMELNLPSTMAPGRHMMVWVWSYNGAPQWTTCFDVNISGSAASPAPNAPSVPAPSAPKAPESYQPPAPQTPSQKAPEPIPAAPAAPAAPVVPAPAVPAAPVAPVDTPSPKAPEAVPAPINTPPAEEPKKTSCRSRKHSRQF